MQMKKFYMMLLAMLLAIPAMSAGTVEFYFQDGEEDDFEINNPQAYVSIWNATDEEKVSVPDDLAFMNYNVTGTVMLRIEPDDFDYEVTVSVEGDLDMYNLEKDENQWFLTLYEGADDLQVYVSVYLKGFAPGGDQISEVSMSFNISAASDSGVTDAGTHVGISYFDRSTFQDVEMTIEDNFASASVSAGTSFTLTPEEGYEITDIYTYIDGVASISKPGDGETEWRVAVSDSPSSDFGSFFVEIGKASGEGPGDGGDEPGEKSDLASITHVADYQWQVMWEDYDFIVNPDSDYNDNNVTLTGPTGNKITLYNNAHDNQEATIFFPEEYGNYFVVNLGSLNLANGDYTLSIPAGYVNLIDLGEGTTPCPAQDLSLVLGEEVNEDFPVTISALEGNYFDISWKNVVSLKEANNTGAYMVNVETSERYDMKYLEDYNYSQANLRIYNGNVLRVNVTNNYPNLPDGTYKFYLPANYVTFNGTTTGNNAIEGHEFTYVAPWTPGEVEFNGPANGKITATWVDATAIAWNEDYAGDGDKIHGVTVFNNVDDTPTDVSKTNITISENVMTIDISSLNLSDGEYSILIPEDCLMVTVDGITDTNDSERYEFTIGDVENPDTPGIYNLAATWNVETNGTIYRDMLVEVSWKDFELTLVAGAEEASVRSDATGALFLEYGTEVYLSEDNMKLMMDLGKIPAGTYRINVPEACVEFKVDGVSYRNQGSSMDNVIISNLGGVAVVGADASGRYRVVNFSGVTVLDTDDASAIEALPRGLYIINGQKVAK